MFLNLFAPLVLFAGLACAHFHVLEPQWRGDSFAGDASQWIFPCANVSELSGDSSNRTLWPHTGGSVMINGSHPWALTYVNLGLGTNVSAFNITLVENFNQTGKGVLCLKEAGKSALEEGLAASNISMDAMEGMHATVQIIQISHTGASLYNCADITFSSNATLLSDDECRNGTGVSGAAIQNADTPSQTSPSGSAESTGAASSVKPLFGSGLLAGLIAWGFL